VLAPGRVGLTVAGGGGAGQFTINDNNASGRGVGAEARVRVGLPGDQEVGLGGIAGISLPHTADSVAGGNLSYKIAPRRWLAFVGELGVLDKIVSTTVIFAGSVAGIVAPYTADNGSQLYMGLKGGLSIPVLQDSSATTEVISLPVGYSWHATERMQLIAELGIGYGMEQINSGGTTTPTSGYGGYGLVAFGYTLR